MNNKQRLQKLRELKIENVNTAFSTQQEWNDWADNIAPLLKYDPHHYTGFINSLRHIRSTTLSADTIRPQLNNMVGIVKQVIIELENKIESYWYPKAIKQIWPDSFWGKLLIGTILICVAFILKTFAFPVLIDLLPQKQQAPQSTNHQVKIEKPHTSKNK